MMTSPKSNTRPLTRLHTGILCGICLILACSRSLIAAPTISNLTVRGIQLGGKTTIAVDGKDLLPNPRLFLNIPVARQSLHKGATPTRLTFDIELDGSIAAGLRNLRVVNEHGVSNAIPVIVDRLSQSPMIDKIPTLPASLHGTLAGSTVVKSSFNAKSKQRVIVEVESNRLGGKLRPVIHLYDKSRKQVGLAFPARSLKGDTRLTVDIPSDGEYTIEIHDLQYAAPQPAFFRVKVGEFRFADLSYPIAIQSGKASTVELVGNLGDKAKVIVTPEAHRSRLQVPFPPNELTSGPRPVVLTSPFPELVETAQTKDVQKVTSIPSAISGKLDAKGQVDRYRVLAKEGQKLRFRVTADTIGSNIDSFLEIRNDKDAVVASNDDNGNSPDSQVDYTVAKGLKWIDVVVRDQAEAASSNSIYRISIEPIGQPALPSIALSVESDAINVPSSATQVFRVTAKRSGYKGAIQVEPVGLPKGFEVKTSTIPADRQSTLLFVTGPPAASLADAFRIKGSSVEAKSSLVAWATFEKHTLASLHPTLKEELAIGASTANQSAFAIQWRGNSKPLVLGTTFKAPVRLKRPSGHIGPVRLSLVSSQLPPLVKGKPNAALAVRAEKATVDFPLDPKVKTALDSRNALMPAVSTAEKALNDVKKQGETRLADSQKRLEAAQAVKTQSLDELKKALTRFALAESANNQTGASLKTATSAALAATKENKIDADANLKQAVSEHKAARKEFEIAAETLKNTSQGSIASDELVAQRSDELKKTVAEINKQQQPFVVAYQKAKQQLDTAQANLDRLQAALPTDVDFNVIVPPALSIGSCDIAIKSELRSLDNKRILATVFTPIRRLSAVHPLSLQLDKKQQTIQLLPKKVTSVIVKGKIERKHGFAGDVTVTVAGLPKGIKAPTATLKPNVNAYQLTIQFPAGFKPTDLKSLRVTGSGPPNPKAPKTVVQQQETFSLKLMAKS